METSLKLLLPLKRPLIDLAFEGCCDGGFLRPRSAGEPVVVLLVLVIPFPLLLRSMPRVRLAVVVEIDAAFFFFFKALSVLLLLLLPVLLLVPLEKEDEREELDPFMLETDGGFIPSKKEVGKILF